MQDRDGRPYAKLSQLKAGDTLECDSGFTCLQQGEHCLVEFDSKEAYELKATTEGFYITCADGQHFLSGQADDGEHLVGLYKVEKNK